MSDPSSTASGASSNGWGEKLARLILGIAGIGALVASIVVIAGNYSPMDKLKLASGYAALIFLFLLSMAVLVEIVLNRIDLSEMLEEMTGGASMSRFQLLIFTFVFGFSFFVIVLNLGKFPDIPNNVLVLLGLSASTYGVGKGLQVGSGQVTPSGDDSAADKKE